MGAGSGSMQQMCPCCRAGQLEAKSVTISRPCVEQRKNQCVRKILPAARVGRARLAASAVVFVRCAYCGSTSNVAT